jgi:hypothetical protein
MIIRSVRKYVAVSTAATLILVPGAGIAATLFSGATVQGQTCLFGDPYCSSGPYLSLGSNSNQSNSVSNAGSGAASSSGATYVDPRLGTSNSASASSSVGMGFLRLTAFSNVSSAPPIGESTLNLQRLWGHAEGQGQDKLTVAPPTPAQQNALATVTGSFRIEGSLAASATNISSYGFGLFTAASNWTVGYSIANAFVGNFETGFFGQAGVKNGITYLQGPSLPVTIPVTFNVRLGVPFDFQFSAAVNASVVLTDAMAKPLTEGLSVGSAGAAFGNTLFWNGISSVVSGGQTLTEFTVTSESGANYANALNPQVEAQVIPVPATFWLLATGCLSLLGWARRARWTTP